MTEIDYGKVTGMIHSTEVLALWTVQGFGL